jgi:hypothetical protein
VIVITADQRASRTRADLVPGVLDRLSVLAAPHAPALVLPFERTVGDEVQGVIDATEAGARLAVELVGDLLRGGDWSVGIGVGAVARPLPATSRAASGPAFVRARRAVDEAKRRGSAVPLAVRGDELDPGAMIAADAQALLRLTGAVSARRSAAGWEAIDTLARHEGTQAPQRATAAALGVSEQAVSQRLRAASWSEELAARPLAARLLRAADAAAEAGDAADGAGEDDTEGGDG